MWGRGKALRPFILGLLFLALLVTGISSQIEITPTVPDHATVLVNWQSKTYFSPPYVEEVPTPTDLEPMTLKMARGWSCWPDRDCVNWSGQRGEDGGFKGEPYNLLTFLLANLGFAPPLPSRWNSDGTWNY